MTKSGINTQNIEIRNENAQQALTGQSITETLAAIKTNISTDNAESQSGKLENRFDKNALQKELNIQVEATKGFVQTASAAGNAIANKLDEEAVAKQREAQAAQEAADRVYKANPSKENEAALNTANQNLITANNEADKWQTGGEYKRKIDGAMNAISAALGGLPAAGIATSAISPEINHQIKLATEGSPMANKVAHAVWGAVEAYSANQNAAAGAGGALAGEVMADVIAKELYGKKPNQLNREEKEVVSSVSQAAGALVGGMAANSSQGIGVGLTTTKNAVENNYLFRQEAEEKAILMRKVNNNEATEEEKARLSQLEKLDSERDSAIINICSHSVSSWACQSLVNEAQYARSGYEQSLSYNLKFKELYPKDYQNVENILKGKDANSVEFEKIAINWAKEKNVSLAEAKSFLNKVYAYKAFAELVGATRAGTALNYVSTKLPKGANANEKLPIIGKTKGYENQNVRISGGEYRANLYSKNWTEANLNKSIEKFAGKNPIITMTDKGKRIYENPTTKVQVVEDINGKYFRIYDPSIRGKRSYLDLNGVVPNNKTLDNGKKIGRTQSEYNQVTHFKIKE